MRHLDPATRRALISHALAAVSMSLPWPLLLVLVWQDTHDETAAGLAAASRMLPYVALSWLAARLADRMPRGRLVRLTLAARVVLLAASALAIEADRTTLAVAAASLAVAAATPAYPALAAAMPGLARQRSSLATDLLVTVEVASFAVGPALGGLLLGGSARELLPWAAVAGSALAAVLLMRLQAPAPLPAGPGAAHRVLPVVRRSRDVRGAIVVMAGVNLVLGLVGVALLPLAELHWGGGEVAFGWATAALGLGSLGAPLLVRLGRSPSARVRWGLVLMAVALAALAPLRGWLAPLALLALAGAAAVHVEAAATVALQRGTPDPVRASVLGLGDSIMVGAAMVGALAGPLLLRVSGPSWLVLVVAALLLACLPALPRTAPPAREVAVCTVAQVQQPVAEPPSGAGSIRSLA